MGGSKVTSQMAWWDLKERGSSADQRDNLEKKEGRKKGQRRGVP